mgnify:CR=1 FL=1
MKATGIVRKVDALGRIVIPKELRDIGNMEEGTPLEIYTDGGQIILKKYEPDCIFCGEVEGVVNWKGKNICKKCLHELRAKVSK